METVFCAGRPLTASSAIGLHHLWINFCTGYFEPSLINLRCCKCLRGYSLLPGLVLYAVLALISVLGYLQFS
jgi:hypothetical protein